MGSNTLSRRKKVHRRIRKHIEGTSERPRLSVFRSNKEIYAQLIDDATSSTLVSASSKEVNGDSKCLVAKEVGKLVAQRAIEKGIKTVVFDRSGYIYHGRVKALAEGARGTQNEDGTNELLQF